MGMQRREFMKVSVGTIMIPQLPLPRPPQDECETVRVRITWGNTFQWRTVKGGEVGPVCDLLERLYPYESVGSHKRIVGRSVGSTYRPIFQRLRVDPLYPSKRNLYYAKVYVNGIECQPDTILKDQDWITLVPVWPYWDAASDSSRSPVS